MVHTSVLMHRDAKVLPTGIDAVTFPRMWCVCNFDMRFTYVHAGWEGSVHNSRVMQKAIANLGFQFPWLPRGERHIHLVYCNYSCCYSISYAIRVKSPFLLLQAHTILSIRGMPLVLHSFHCISRSDITHKSLEVLPDNLEFQRSSLTTGIPCSAWSLSGVLECWKRGSRFLMTCTPIHSLDNNWSSSLVVRCTTLSTCIATPMKCFMHGKDKT